MPALDLASKYVQDIRATNSTGSATVETSFYPDVGRLFNAIGETLKPRVLFVSQLRTQGAGLPDGGFFPQRKTSHRNPTPQPLTNPERGAVEIKPAGFPLDTLTHSDQTRRYLRQYGIVLITNLREFRLLGLDPAGRPRNLEPPYVLFPTAEALWSGALDPKHNALLPDFLKRVMLYKVPLTQPKDVAWLLASYAREARARAEDHELPAFRNVKLALEESLGIQFEGERGEHFFRSTLVQTLFYGIFSAWVLWRHSPEGRIPHAQFNWRLADDYLRVPILRKLFREVSDRHHLNTIQLTEILELAGEALNRVDPQLFDIFQGEQAVAYFYEPFLQAFDPQLRKDLGVWYTPREIVHYMVERVDHLLRTELSQPLGLASPAVRILDPCCGTGAYLTAVLERIHRTLLDQAGDDTALVPAALRTAALTRVFGFEIMPAPFTIAHMEIARFLEDAGAPIQDHQRAGIFLTNALTGWIPIAHPKVIFEELEQEREAADEVKQRGTILVILGNPPYNGYAGIAIGEERDLSDAYRDPVVGVKAPEGQGLNELYVRFFRMAERRIGSNRGGQGIVSFISNYSWLDGLSHPTMRHSYLKRFNKIYIDNLHGDRKISEYAPDGRTSETVFAVVGTSVGIRVGTAISTLVRTSPVLNEMRIQYRDFEEARAADRRDALIESLKSHHPEYVIVTPNPRLGVPFKPRAFGLNYFGWPLFTEVIPISHPGVQTGRDDLVVHIERKLLETRIEKYLNKEFPHSEMEALIPGTMKDSKRFEAEAVRSSLQNRKFRPWQVRRFAYRPFDSRWLYWEPTTKLLDEKREEYQRQYLPDVPVIFLAQKNRKSYDPPGITHLLGNRHLNERGANMFPQFVMGEALPGELEVRTNITDAIIAYIDKAGVASEDIFFHSLATMHTPCYKEENAGALLGDWPRIPLSESPETIRESATLGRQLAKFLDAESPVHLAQGWSFLSVLKLPPGTLDEHRLRISVGWGRRGPGNTVAPGEGMAVPRRWTATERDRLATLAATQSLTLEVALTLLGETCLDIHLNGHAYWSAVPAKVWTYTLGGYQVLKKWLSYRELPLLGRPLHPEESDYFAQVVRRIAAILLMGPALDASYAAILPTATGLPTASPPSQPSAHPPTADA